MTVSSSNLFVLPTPGGLSLVLLLAMASVAFLTWRCTNRVTHITHQEAYLASLTVLGFGLLDWATLAGLPLLELSFGPLEPALALFTAGRAVIFLVAIFIMLLWGLIRRRHAPPPGRTGRISPGLAALWALNLVLFACEVDGLYIEPFNLQTTRLELAAPVSIAGKPAEQVPLRIVHLSDLHIERTTLRERELVETVKALNPDLILMTGDYLNIDYTEDPQSRRDGRDVLAQLSAPFGVYAIVGSPPVDTSGAMNAVFEGLAITVLRDEIRRLQFEGGDLYLVGITLTNRKADSATLQRLMSAIPAEAYSLLLYHTPDLIEAAAAERVDLYLAGHTHGGQVRLPLWGALVTMSAYGKQYESGLYELGSTKMIISRGVGMEGLRLPRLRFLCPPEVILIELGGEAAP